MDPKRTALLEEEPPEGISQQPDGDASSDRAFVEEYAADRIRLSTSTEAPGLLVLSEVYYPAWKAYVDGEPAPVRVADQLLRSVEVPEGEHEVELRYESGLSGWRWRSRSWPTQRSSPWPSPPG